jgi:hypothetical protein
MISAITRHPLEQRRSSTESRPAWLDESDWEATESAVATYDSPSSLSSRVESSKFVLYCTVYSLPNPAAETSIPNPQGKAFLAASGILCVGELAGWRPRVERPKNVTDTDRGRVLGLPAPFLGSGPVHSFPLAGLLSLSAADDREAAIDLVIDFFDDRLIADLTADCDAALDLIGSDGVDRVPPSVLVSILGVTLRAKTFLKSRAAFFDRVFASVGRRKGHRYAKSLLEKYR